MPSPESLSGSDSFVIAKEPCPDCGSRDNLARYSDGHAHCFTPGCGRHESGADEDTPPHRHSARKPMSRSLVQEWESRPLPARKLTQDSCERWKYGIGTFNGKPCQIANYYPPEGGTPVAQKLRFEGKDFTVRGDLKQAGLYGQHLWRDKGKMIVVTEGEIDAITVSQVQGHKWPVVSIPNGCQGARKALAAQLEWLLGFDTIVLFFDNDEPGQAVVEECAALFPSGRCKVAKMANYKDPNEALKAGHADAIVEAIWGAKEYRPDGIVTLAEVAQSSRTPTAFGHPWFTPTLTKLTNGRRLGELHLIGAGTGVGKTWLLYHQAEHDLREGRDIGLHLMEAGTDETLRAIAGIRLGVAFHEQSQEPGAPVDEAMQERYDKAVADVLASPGTAYVLDSFGANSWESIRDRIRHLTHANGVRFHFVDNLTTLAAAEDLGEKEAVEKITSQAASLARELNVWIGMVSHLSTAEGTAHEDGGEVKMKHFRGSRAVGYWSWVVIGVERDTQAEDEDVRAMVRIRIVKCRPKGSSTGKTFWLRYDPKSSRLVEYQEEEL